MPVYAVIEKAMGSGKRVRILREGEVDPIPFSRPNWSMDSNDQEIQAQVRAEYPDVAFVNERQFRQHTEDRRKGGPKKPR